MVADGEKALGLGRGSAWPLTPPSGDSPESWTSTGPRSGPELHQQKVLKHNRKKTVRDEVAACSTQGERESIENK